MMIMIIIIISTEQTTKTIVSTNYRIRDSSPRSRHNKYLKSSKISPYSQIVNKIHFNIITFSISKYQKRVLTSEVPTQIMRAFLKCIMRDSSSDYPKRVMCSHQWFWRTVRLTKLLIARFVSVLWHVLNILNTVLVSQTAQSCHSLAFCGYRRQRLETCGTVRSHRHFGPTSKTCTVLPGDTF